MLLSWQLCAVDEGRVTLNIVDRRNNVHRCKSIDFVVEEIWHDNCIPGGDQAQPDYREPSYVARKGVSLAEAIIWTSSLSVPVTLYLYDEGRDAVSHDWPPKGGAPD